MKFDSLLLKEAVLEADCLIPPLRQDENSSSSSESEDDLDQCDAGYAKGPRFSQSALITQIKIKALIILFVQVCFVEAY